MADVSELDLQLMARKRMFVSGMAVVFGATATMATLSLVSSAGAFQADGRVEPARTNPFESEPIRCDELTADTTPASGERTVTHDPVTGLMEIVGRTLAGREVSIVIASDDPTCEDLPEVGAFVSETLSDYEAFLEETCPQIRERLETGNMKAEKGDDLNPEGLAKYHARYC